MNMNEYQSATKDTAIYNKTISSSVITVINDEEIEKIIDVLKLSYVSLGLVGEAGEIANKVKKIIRDKDLEINFETRMELYNELGDVYWYLSELCSQLGTSLQYIAALNTKKLETRKKNNTLQGSGDNR